MWVWDGGQEGTIGGGRLEWEAAALARAGHIGVHRLSLGPGLGQCCGGAVTLFISEWRQDVAPTIRDGVCAYGPDAEHIERPTKLPHRIGDTVIEALSANGMPVYIWGAGHVGRALVGVLAPFPGIALHWVDLPEKFPAEIPTTTTKIPAAQPETLTPHVRQDSHHLILTHSHDTDLALCHGLLIRRVARIGLIGSATKWARFRNRLRQMGHADAEIDTIRCPIGDPTLGKHPQAIAIGVAADILRGMGHPAA